MPVEASTHHLPTSGPPLDPELSLAAVWEGSSLPTLQSLCSLEDSSLGNTWLTKVSSGV